MPMFPSEETVQPILEPHEPRLAAIFDRAWARVSAMPERPNFDLKRTVAVMMHQFVMIELRAEYSAESAVHLIEEHETIRMLIDRKVVVRLKKMDERGYTRAATTQATLAFITPMAPLPFAGEDDFPDQCSVDVGYVLNELGTRIETFSWPRAIGTRYYGATRLSVLRRVRLRHCCRPRFRRLRQPRSSRCQTRTPSARKPETERVSRI
jgi:hypothetical protein